MRSTLVLFLVEVAAAGVWDWDWIHPFNWGQQATTTTTAVPTTRAVHLQEAAVETHGEEEAHEEHDEWTGLCVSGSAQSPVNIHFNELVSQDLGSLIFSNYDTTGVVNVKNSGHSGNGANLEDALSEEISGFLDWETVPTVSGGGLGATYRLNQFHFHWNTDNFAGSEHTLMGMHTPLEAHFVHVREDLDASTASSVPGGIAVVAVLFKVSNDTDNPFVNLDEVITKAANGGISYSPGPLLPKDTTHFLRYNGSLTTPPCSEGVIWTVLSTPLTVLPNQLSLMRQRIESDGSLLRQNWRQTQPLNGRKVLLSGDKMWSQYSRKAAVPFLFALNSPCVVATEREVLTESAGFNRYKSICDAALNMAFSLLHV